MTEPNIIIHLTGFKLPRDYAWRVGFVDTMKRNIRHCGYDDRGYRAPRFVGYYFRLRQLVGVCADGDVHLSLDTPARYLNDQVNAATGSKYPIAPVSGEIEPGYILVHDAWSRDCWLLSFSFGMRFLAGHSEDASPDNEDEE